MTFEQWWESDEAFAYRHADERTQAEAAWGAAMEAAIEAIKTQANGPIGGAPCSGAFNLGLHGAANIVRKLNGE